MISTSAQPQCLKDPSQEWLRDEKDAMQVGIQSVNRRALKTARVTSGRRDKDKRQASRRSHSNYHNDTLLGSKHHHSSLLVIITHLRNTTFPPTRWISQLLTQPPTNKHLLRGSPLSYWIPHVLLNQIGKGHRNVFQQGRWWSMDCLKSQKHRGRGSSMLFRTFRQQEGNE